MTMKIQSLCQLIRLTQCKDSVFYIVGPKCLKQKECKTSCTYKVFIVRRLTLSCQTHPSSWMVTHGRTVTQYLHSHHH